MYKINKQEKEHKPRNPALRSRGKRTTVSSRLVLTTLWHMLQNKIKQKQNKSKGKLDLLYLTKTDSVAVPAWV